MGVDHQMKTGGPTWAVSQKTGSYFSSKIITNHLKTIENIYRTIQRHPKTSKNPHKKQSKNIEKKHLWKATSDPLTPFKIPDLPVRFVQDTPLAATGPWVSMGRTGWSREGALGTIYPCISHPNVWRYLCAHVSLYVYIDMKCICYFIYIYIYLCIICISYIANVYLYEYVDLNIHIHILHVLL